jgi:hypothetical protein
MTRFKKFFARIGYLRAASELDRMGYATHAATLREEARRLQ